MYSYSILGISLECLVLKIEIAIIYGDHFSHQFAILSQLSMKHFPDSGVTDSFVASVDCFLRGGHLFLLFLAIFSSLLSLNFYLKYKRVEKTLKVHHGIQILKDRKRQTQKLTTDIGVPEYIVLHIMAALNHFEESKGFLSKEISMQRLSEEINTNSSYLSKVINLKKGSKFTQYLSDLRINYAKSEIRRNSKFQMYTIKAIAEECGFKSAESFSKAFRRKHGVYPSEYIQQLNEKKVSLE